LRDKTNRHTGALVADSFFIIYGFIKYVKPQKTGKSGRTGCF